VQIDIRPLGPGDDEALLAAGALFDGPPERGATRRFLEDPLHHMLVAYDDAGQPVGFVSGVETTHPDKGTEMFLYELSVDERSRRRGIGSALVRALGALARERGCYGMWTGTEDDNAAARATYARAGAREEPPHVFVAWNFGEG
jgi:ribosomal protein S18 acetylase RimI-like enzyme